MPYENVPTENTPALPPRADEYQFAISIDGTLANGEPRATIDDLALFDPSAQTNTIAMLDFLDRVVVRVTLRGEVLTTPVAVKDGDTERVDQQVEGVRGKKIPIKVLRSLYTTVGNALRESQNAGN